MDRALPPSVGWCIGNRATNVAAAVNPTPLSPSANLNMLNLFARIGLSILVTLAEAVGRLVWPAGKLCVKHSRGVYGTRHWAHLHAYCAAPGWMFIELGSWTVEASWSSRRGMSRLKSRA